MRWPSRRSVKASPYCAEGRRKWVQASWHSLKGRSRERSLGTSGATQGSAVAGGRWAGPHPEAAHTGLVTSPAKAQGALARANISPLTHALAWHSCTKAAPRRPTCSALPSRGTPGTVGGGLGAPNPRYVPSSRSLYFLHTSKSSRGPARRATRMGGSMTSETKCRGAILRLCDA